MLKKWHAIEALGLAVIIGGAVGWFVRNDRLFMMKSVAVSPTIQVRIDSPQYPLINPLLYSDSAKDTSAEYKMLATSMSSYIDSSKKAGTSDNVSVYFRDLNSAEWTGVNENDTYTPGSMLKIVAMMSVLKLSESDPSFFDTKFYYQATSTAFEHYPSTDDLPSGLYSVRDLMSDMIVYSDNAALDALLSDKAINNEFTSLYDLFRLPVSSSPNDYMSPKSYAVLFRTLYNSTLFQWILSEQVLDLLTKTTFNEGLVAGVPDTVAVAHKFGESNDILIDGQTEHELHDCGIIYYPDDPYLLCIMTKGQDFTSLQEVVSGLSKIAYQFVDQKDDIK